MSGNNLDINMQFLLRETLAAVRTSRGLINFLEKVYAEMKGGFFNDAIIPPADFKTLQALQKNMGEAAYLRLFSPWLVGQAGDNAVQRCSSAMRNTGANSCPSDFTPNILLLNKSFTAKAMVVGSLHADFYALLQAVFKALSRGYNIIFLGDLINDGALPVETMVLPLILLKHLPERVILLRGDNETYAKAFGAGDANNLQHHLSTCHRYRTLQRNQVLMDRARVAFCSIFGLLPFAAIGYDQKVVFGHAAQFLYRSEITTKNGNISTVMKVPADMFSVYNFRHVMFGHYRNLGYAEITSEKKEGFFQRYDASLFYFNFKYIFHGHQMHDIKSAFLYQNTVCRVSSSRDFSVAASSENRERCNTPYVAIYKNNKEPQVEALDAKEGSIVASLARLFWGNADMFSVAEYSAGDLIIKARNEECFEALSEDASVLKKIHDDDSFMITVKGLSERVMQQFMSASSRFSGDFTDLGVNFDGAKKSDNANESENHMDEDSSAASLVLS